jgi:DNA-directed RNA polymerase subunit RPC12/RpoP
MKRLEMVGRHFGKWLVLEEVEKRNNKRAFLCRCNCGKEHVVMGDNLRSGDSTRCQSCSSKIKGPKRKTHGLAGTSIYAIWRTIKVRCRIPSYIGFKYYGGRGIDVCERWFDSFEAFLEDMGPRPSSKHQIDRINNDGNYEPGNCRWVLPKQQQNNKRNNVVIFFNGESRSVAEWAQALGVNESTLYMRLKAGWSPDKVISISIRQKQR